MSEHGTANTVKVCRETVLLLQYVIIFIVPITHQAPSLINLTVPNLLTIICMTYL